MQSAGSSHDQQNKTLAQGNTDATVSTVRPPNTAPPASAEDSAVFGGSDVGVQPYEGAPGFHISVSWSGARTVCSSAALHLDINYTVLFFTIQ